MNIAILYVWAMTTAIIIFTVDALTGGLLLQIFEAGSVRQISNEPALNRAWDYCSREKPGTLKERE